MRNCFSGKSPNLFIIGNGYDLQCGLKSSFKDFYEKSLSTGVNWYLNNKDKLFYDGHIEDYKSEYRLTIFDLILYAVSYPNARYYVNTKKSLGFYNQPKCWYDVENILKTFILAKDKLYTYFASHLNIYNQHKYFGAIDSNDDRGFFDGYLYHRLNDYRKLGYERFIKKELEIFENNFQKYLSNEIKDNSNYNYNVGLLNRMIGIEPQDIILNFNYTSICGLNQKYKEEINVHGYLKDKIIIGIDNNFVNYDQSYAIPFTKTYRKLNDNIYENQMTLDPDTDHIYFYGHSLSEQDYSYFQSIFDYYHIYDSKVHLHFYYAMNFDIGDEETYISSLTDKIFKLINEYGKTLNNKDNGKNLLHKMLLEGRIEMKRVDLG